MKVKVIKKSFYGNRLNKIGDVIEISEKTVPSWAEAIKESKLKEEPEKKDNKAQDKETENKKTGDDKAQDKKENSIADSRLEELSKLTEDEIREKLDALLNESIDKGIMIEFEDKSDIQLIIELSDLLEGKE